MKKSRKESELNTVDSQIRGLETRLRFAKTDMESTVSNNWLSIQNRFMIFCVVLQTKQIQMVEKELSRLDEEMKKYGPQIETIEKSMQVREQQIEEIKLRMNSVEDVVFSNFCREIGVQNIRQYEDRELRAQEERKKKRLEFEKQINRITSNLDFEKSRDTQSKYSI